MSDMTADYTGGDESLGVGAIISETFSIFFKRIVQIVSLGFIISFLSIVISGLVVGFDFVAGGAAADPADLSGFNGLGMVVMMVVNILAYAILIGAMVLLAYDAKLGRSARTGTYIRAALANSMPIFLLTVVFTILSTIGFILLVVPGLWVYAVFSVFVPAIVIEGAGFKALGRSRSLTQGYRWPIVGLLFMIGLIMMVLMIGVGLVVALPLGFVASSGTGGTIVSMILQALASGISYGLASIPVALIYARLREIKEGVSVDSMADVFK